MDNEITAKIISFISTRQVVLNKGKNDGIAVGMLFGVKLNVPKIVDPDDGSNALDGLYYEKGQLKIDAVYDRMSFASIIPKKIFSFPSMDFFPVSEKYEYPPILEEPIISEKNWKIKIGDEVFLKKDTSEERNK